MGLQCSLICHGTRIMATKQFKARHYVKLRSVIIFKYPLTCPDIPMRRKSRLKNPQYSQLWFPMLLFLLIMGHDLKKEKNEYCKYYF